MRSIYPIMIRLVYYCEEHDVEIEVKAKSEDFDIESHKPLKCIFTGEIIDDFYYDDLDKD